MHIVTSCARCGLGRDREWRFRRVPQKCRWPEKETPKHIAPTATGDNHLDTISGAKAPWECPESLACYDADGGDSISSTTGRPIPPWRSGGRMPFAKTISRRFRSARAEVMSQRITRGSSLTDGGSADRIRPLRITWLGRWSVVIATRIWSLGVIPVGAFKRRRNQTGPGRAGNSPHSSGSRMRVQVHACVETGVGTAHSHGPCRRMRWTEGSEDLVIKGFRD